MLKEILDELMTGTEVDVCNQAIWLSFDCGIWRRRNYFATTCEIISTEEAVDLINQKLATQWLQVKV